MIETLTITHSATPDPLNPAWQRIGLDQDDLYQYILQKQCILKMMRVRRMECFCEIAVNILLLTQIQTMVVYPDSEMFNDHFCYGVTFIKGSLCKNILNDISL